MIKFIDKYSQKIFRVLFFALLGSFVLAFICKLFDFPFLYFIAFGISGIVFIINFFIFGVKIAKKIKYSLYNINHCGVECFEKIDALKSFWNNDKSNNYKRQISYINYCYSKDGPVGKLIDEGNLADLYIRKDFLNSKINFSSEIFEWALGSFSTIVFSLFLNDSTINQFILNYPILKNFRFIFVYIIPLILYFFYIIFLRYGEKKEFKSYKNFVNEYELKLLDKAIESIYNKCEMKCEDENLLFTQQYVLKYLINLRGNFFTGTGINKKKEIEADIDCVENLNLFVDDYSSFKIKEYDFNYSKKADERINLKKIYILYKKDNDKKFANEEFKKLFDIIIKYNIIKL